MTKQDMTWTLTHEEAAATRAKLDKINARAQQRGFTGRVTMTTAPVQWTDTTAAGTKVTRHGLEATITGDAPCYGNYRFLGVVTTVEGTVEGADSVMFSGAPGVADVDLATLTPGACDHCNRKRNRAKSMLVENTETGERLQVGSTCIKDFLGWDTLPVFLWADDVQAKLRGGQGAGQAGYDTLETLAWAWACVKAFGWAPASAPASTRDAVEACMIGRSSRDDEIRRAAADMYEEGMNMAPKVVDRLHAEFAGATAGYEGNMLAVLNRDAIVTAKTRGLLVSAVPAYQKAIGREVERQAREKAEAEVPSAWLGTVGEKLEVEGTVTRVTACSTMYGTTNLVVVLTEGGAVKMFTAAGWSDDVEVGSLVRLVGTVKEHGEYNGRRETTMTRVKALDVTSPEVHAEV